jgi:hypothetical protein
MVDVLVRQRDVLQHRDEFLLALQPLDQLGHRIEPRQRVQRAAVMTGRHLGGAGHRQRRGRQHRRDRDPGAQLVQSAIDDLLRRRLFDKLHQRLDGVGILDTLWNRHGWTLRQCSRKPRLPFHRTMGRRAQ